MAQQESEYTFASQEDFAAAVRQTVANLLNGQQGLPFVDHDITAHRDTLNQIMLRLGGPEHAFPEPYLDPRIVLPELSEDPTLSELVSSYTLLRQALIKAKMAKAPE